MIKRLKQYVSREFELNRRQTHFFLLLAILFVALLILFFYDPWSKPQKLDYKVVYDLEEEEVRKAEEFVAKYEKPKRKEATSSGYNKRGGKTLFLGNINELSADSLQAIKGIGKVLSERVVKYRERLGGFYSLHQLHEVYGLDSAVVDRIKNSCAISGNCNKIDVNLASYKELISHPYLEKEQVVKLLNLRKQKNFLSEENLRNVLDSVVFVKVSPYLSY